MTPKRRTTMPPIEVDAGLHGPLGMPAEEFLAHYWQKHPLLIRNAFPGYASPLEPEDLAGLACEEGVLARLVQHDRSNDGWTLSNGPFDEALFPTLGVRDWTLLVQDMDKWDPALAALRDSFAFLPRWRIDDVMVSFAVPGGSVGAHVDQYDVFLLQAQGHRRWQIDARAGAPKAFRDGVPLKLLQHFEPSHDWLLGPGDMLYLPPDVPHFGEATDACLTFSLGMRAPSSAELLADYADTLLAAADDAVRYHDPDLATASDPFEIDAAAMQRVTEALNRLRMRDPDEVGAWFGRFITLYRNAGAIQPPAFTPPRIELEWQLQHGLVLHRHPWTRTAWRRARRGAQLFVAGEAWAMSVRDAVTLAASERVDGALFARLSPSAQDVVHALVCAGHLVMAQDDDPDDPGPSPTD